MPLQASTPIIKDGLEYPYYAINLAISPLWQQTNIGGSVNLRLVPYRIDENNMIHSLPEESKAILFMDIFKDAESDQDIAAAVNGIMSSIQQFILDKNL